MPFNQILPVQIALT